MKKLEQDARQALNWIDANAPRYVFEAIKEALDEQVHTPYCKQAPMCKTPCGNSDCVEQAEQEPVAWMDLHKELGQLRWAGKDIGWDLAIDAVRNRLEELYAAPVRTKDLTDDEIWKELAAIQASSLKRSWLSFARAVIAKDREKNK